MEAREYTEDEVRNQFLDHVKVMVDYWENNVGHKTTKERLEGLAFSILVAIDGGSGLPSFILAPRPHEDDKQYNVDNEENYYPENHNSDVKCDIAGGLHENFFN